MKAKNKKKILITGASGFLGHHVVKLLTQTQKFSVSTFCRSSDPALEKMGVTQIIGSILDKNQLSAAMSGMDHVIHLAGMVSRKKEDAQLMFELHVQGTENVIQSFVSAKIPGRLVYVSTSGTIACSKGPNVFVNENSPYPTDINRNWPYYLSKIEAEKKALSTARIHGVNLICLNPSLLLGPGDSRLSSTEDVLLFLNRKVPAIPGGGVNFVDVRDAAQAVVNSLEMGRALERYLIGGPNWSMREFFSALSDLSGVPCSSLDAPGIPTKIAAIVISEIAKLAKVKSPLDPISVELGQAFWYFNHHKATLELGFVPRSPYETLMETIEDLRQRGLVK